MKQSKAHVRMLIRVAVVAMIASVLPLTAATAQTVSPQMLTIMEIQGDGQFSPYEGEVVTTKGVVTLISADGRDMWIQDPVGDGDDATSDGIKVDDRDSLSTAPNVGDYIEITGEVDEQQFGNALPLTQINDPSEVKIKSSGNKLPAPVKILDLPNEKISEGIEFWEPLEGMRVKPKNSRVVAATTRFGEFSMVTWRDVKARSGYAWIPGQILLRELAPNVVDYNPERILVDDSTLDDPIIVKPGDKVKKLIGVVDYTFGMYKIQPDSWKIVTEDLPDTPVSTRSGMAGNTTITTFNVANLFDLVDNPDKDDEGSTPEPEELETQLTKLAMAIEDELELPAILVVQEVENTAILAELGNRVNAANGTEYEAVSFETSDARGIEVGFLYDEKRVDLLDAYQLSGDDVDAAFGPDSPSPGREPLVGEFRIGKHVVTIVGNHFKSKSGDDPPFGINDPFQRPTEVQRHAQAQVVRDFVNTIFDERRWAKVMVTGDLNDFEFGEPEELPDHTVGILEGGPGEVKLKNLVNKERFADRFTFVFDGNSQVLDHMLVSPALKRRLAGTDILHFNASYPAELSSDPTTTLRASDHDAVEGRFWFRMPKAKSSLSLFHNNDGESQLVNAGSGLEDFGGVARFATVLENARAAAADGSGISGPVYKDTSLLVSSGDNFLAGPEFNASLDKGVPFYDTIALDYLGYDAVSLGNHDFDFGPDILADFIGGYENPGTPPYLSANLDFSGEPRLQELVDDGAIAKSTMIGSGHDAIGVVGAITPALTSISSPRNVVIDPDVQAAVQAEIDKLTAQGVKKIILISHLQDIDGDIALAGELEGIDIMVAGGGDELLAGAGDLLIPGDETEVFGMYPMVATNADGMPVPVVTTSGNYKYLGNLEVDFDWRGNVINWAGGPIRVAGGSNPDAVASDPFLQTNVVDPVVAYTAALAANVIGTSEVDLDGLRSSVRSMETNQGNLIADSLLWQATELAPGFGAPLPDVGLQNGGGIRNDTIIPAGDITELDTFDMVPFPNFVTVLTVPRDQFKEVLENAVSRNVEGDEPGGTGRFAQVAGFSYVYSASGTAQVVDDDGNVLTPGTRVTDVTLDDGTQIVVGGAVQAGDDITIATIDFLARGGDQYPYRGTPVTLLGVSYQQALSAYIQGPLAGDITAADYPEGGEGRITEIP